MKILVKANIPMYGIFIGEEYISEFFTIDKYGVLTGELVGTTVTEDTFKLKDLDCGIIKGGASAILLKEYQILITEIKII